MIKLVDILLEKKTKRDRCLKIADRKFDKPSAYKSGAVVRCRKGDIWKGVKEHISTLSEAEKESLSEQILDFELSVYPNPANDIINIEMPEGFEGEIVVRDISGRVVFESTVNNSFETICQANLSHLQSGSYFVSIIDDENLISKKIQLY